MIDNRVVGRAIATLRQNRNMTQQQLAAALNVSHQAVSKWENGAALPDVQTLLALTKLFGVTMEQLLSGELPPERMAPKSPLEEPIQNLGNFFNNIVTGIFQNGEQPTEDDGAEKSAFEPDDAFDIEKLLQMAPFMSRSAVDAMLLEHQDQLTPADIARFAPFISRECLEKLVQKPNTQINWETLQRIAPFLKREVVDRLARLAVKGGRAAQEFVDGNLPRGEEIGSMIDKAVRAGGSVAREFGNAFNAFVESTTTKDTRVDDLRRAAFERALQDDRWDWLAAHIDEIDDEALLGEIASKARAQGMADWVMEHMADYEGDATVEEALAAGDWDWLGKHIDDFDDDVQARVALAAAEAKQWAWLATYAEELDMGENVAAIAIAAYRDGARSLARQLVDEMDESEADALADCASQQGDDDFIEKIEDELSEEYVGRLCIARAQAGQWDSALRFAHLADEDDLKKLMEMAIAEGNFDAIDEIHPLL